VTDEASVVSVCDTLASLSGWTRAAGLVAAVIRRGIAGHADAGQPVLMLGCFKSFVNC
jgi:hypothetical protein